MMDDGMLFATKKLDARPTKTEEESYSGVSVFFGDIWRERIVHSHPACMLSVILYNDAYSIESSWIVYSIESSWMRV
jgi:hypothetical protein